MQKIFAISSLRSVKVLRFQTNFVFNYQISAASFREYFLHLFFFYKIAHFARLLKYQTEKYFFFNIFFRNKAFESTVQRYSTDEAASSSSMPPILQPYLPRKKCEICKIIIHNEVQLQSHLRGKKHKELISQVNEGRKLSGEEIQTCNLKYIVDAADNEQDPKIAQVVTLSGLSGSDKNGKKPLSG